MRGLDIQSLKYNCVATVAAWWCISHGMQREFCPSILYYRLRYKCKLGAVCLHISTGECKRLHAEQQVVIIYYFWSNPVTGLPVFMGVVTMRRLDTLDPKRPSEDAELKSLC